MLYGRGRNAKLTGRCLGAARARASVAATAPRVGDVQQCDVMRRRAAVDNRQPTMPTTR